MPPVAQAEPQGGFPVLQQETVAGDSLEQTDQAAVGLGDLQLPQKLRFVTAETPVALPAGFPGHGTSDD
jgi:hypothetical protein